MKKIKMEKIDVGAVRGLTIQVDPTLYDKICKVSQDLNLTKRVLISTAIVKLLDEIEVFGVEL